MTKVCPSCHQPNYEQAAFCSSCSAPLIVGSAPAPPFQQQQWSPPGGPMVGQPAAQQGASQRAIISVVLAALTPFCCGILSGIPAAILGWMELDAINKGQSSPAGKWMAQVGLWGGIGFSILHIIFSILWVIFSALAQ